MRRRLLLAAPLLPAAAPAAVDLLLVLAVDASGSISADEFALQREGYAEALTSAPVLEAIARKPRGIAVSMAEWGSPGGAATVVPWMRVADAAGARALAAAVMAAPRSPQSWNAIGDALDHAGEMLRAAPFAAPAQVVDVSGDGPDMRSLRPAGEARDALVAAGVTVNALAIAGEAAFRPGGALAEHYRRHVIGGPGAFVVAAEDRRDLLRALRVKLLREIA